MRFMPDRAAVGILATLILIALTPCVSAAEPSQEPLEKRVLMDSASASQWSAAECTIESSKAHMRSDRPVLRWHVTVDHFAGEAKYPIGWPRINYTFREAAARDWSAWDYFQMWIYTDTNRAGLPREPVGLSIQAPDKDSSDNRPLTMLKKGEWVQIKIPLNQLPRRQDVRLIQLHISESNYKHQDQLDFYLDEVALLRYARPTLLEFSAEAAVVFADAKRIPVQFNLAGVKSDERVMVTCELRQNGNILARSTVDASRGPHRINLDLSQAKPRPGNYELLARVAGGAETAAVPVRLVESPWPAME